MKVGICCARLAASDGEAEASIDSRDRTSTGARVVNLVRPASRVPVTMTASTSVTTADSVVGAASAALADCAVITSRLVAASNQDFETEVISYPPD